MQLNIQPIYPTQESDATNYFYFPEGFSKEELDAIYKAVDRLPFKSATVGLTEEKAPTEMRSSSVKWIPKTDEWGWLYGRLFQLANEANDALWHFNLITALDDIQYTEYYSEKGGHYDWHQDIGPGPMSKRKVSITVQLSNPDEYEGGDLEIFMGGNHTEKAPKGAGLVYIFPSYMMHRVTKITKGTRRSFVLWIGGEHYK
jgi:PKHD-type hydroxylase